jgi:hypothetical protein
LTYVDIIKDKTYYRLKPTDIMKRGDLFWSNDALFVQPSIVYGLSGDLVNIHPRIIVFRKIELTAKGNKFISNQR